MEFRTAWVTVSDKGYKGEREDQSGPEIERMLLEQGGFDVVRREIVPDDQEMIEKLLIQLCDEEKVDLIFTTGGTGLSARDVTPEATLRIGEKNVPGIAEAIRSYSMTITKRAMLGRGASVIRGRTLIINLPGSPKGVKESLSYILPVLAHGVEILTGEAADCGHIGEEKTGKEELN